MIAFAGSLRECEEELRSTFEDWILVGLKLGHPLPCSRGLARLAGSRSEEESRELQEVVRGFDDIDDELWR